MPTPTAADAREMDRAQDLLAWCQGRVDGPALTRARAVLHADPERALLPGIRTALDAISAVISHLSLLERQAALVHERDRLLAAGLSPQDRRISRLGKLHGDAPRLAEAEREELRRRVRTLETLV